MNSGFTEEPFGPEKGNGAESSETGNGSEKSKGSDAMDIARDAMERGWNPVPIPRGLKSPQKRGWQNIKRTPETLAQYFTGDMNVGAQMGPMSNGLTDVDHDCIEAIILAPAFLPETEAIYGRASKRRSHRFYYIDDPEPKAWIQWKDDKQKVLLELRLGGGGKGAQSVLPGSVHTSGEIYEWDVDGEPAKSTCAVLKPACIKLVVAALLMRHWPQKGALHETALAVGGFLARAGWSGGETEHFVYSICSALRDVQEPQKHGKTARDSVEQHAAGGHVYGLPKMIEIFGEAVATTAAKHLGYKSRSEAPEPPQTGRDGRPVVPFVELSATADRAEEILLAAQVPFYQRGKSLMRPVITAVDTFRGKTTSTAQLIAVELPYMRDVMCRAAHWVKMDGRSHAWVKILPPAEVAMVLLNRVGNWRFPALAGLISTPTLRPDGTILAAPGFDAATRLLLVDPPAMPPIPEQPSREKALAALALLKGLLTEFPFVDTVSRAVALSAYLTVVCRGAFPVAPMHLVTAPVAGSGKSYLLGTVAYIATGQAMPVIGAGGSEEEMEKRLGAAVIAGWPLICLDNMIGKLGGQALCQLVEQPRPHVRILGHSQLVPVEAHATAYFANGNNVTIYGDAIRRVIVCQLDPELERPELRSFASDPVQLIMANRGAYIAAALTICRAYQVAGRPDRQTQIGSFNEWSDCVRSALVWLGEADPLSSMETARAEDPETNELAIMLEAWAHEFGYGKDKGVTLQEAANACNETCQSETGQLEYVNRELREAVLLVLPGHQHPRQQITPAALGYWMRSHKNRRLGDMRFDSTPGPKNTAHRWWVEQVVATAAAPPPVGDG